MKGDISKKMHEPKHDDAVLGKNQVPNTPYNALVLGKIEGAIQQLRNLTLAVKLKTLLNALEYDEQGSTLVEKFIIQEKNASIKWIYINWIWFHASVVARVKLANQTCLKHIDSELMELVLLTMLADITDTITAPVQEILEEINKLHAIKGSYNSLAVKYKNLGDLYCMGIKQGKFSSEKCKIAIIAQQKAITFLTEYNPLIKLRWAVKHLSKKIQA